MVFDVNDFAPLNGHLVLEEVEKESLDDQIPGFEEIKGKGKKKQERYRFYKILTVGIDCKPRLRESGKGRLALVEDSMVEDIVTGDGVMKIVSEAYVVGLVVGLNK